VPLIRGRRGCGWGGEGEGASVRRGSTVESARAASQKRRRKVRFVRARKEARARFRSHGQTVRTFCTAPTVAVIMACAVERKLRFVRWAVGAYLQQGDGEVDGIHVVHDPRARGGVAEGHDNLLAQERLMREGRRGGERPGGRRWKFPAAGKSKSGKGGDAPRPPPVRRRERRSFAGRRPVSP